MGNGAKILFINNTPVDGGIPEELRRAGYHVDIADRAAAGWYALEAGDYDLVILRESLGRESWHFCGELRAFSPFVPLIVISPGASPETCVRAIDAGADYFLRKSFGTLELLGRVRSLLQRASIRQASLVGS